LSSPLLARGGGLRLRITVAFVGGALVVSALVAGISYTLAERYLVRQRVDDAVQQSLSNVRFAVQFLSEPRAREEGEDPEEARERALTQLVDLLEARGASDAMVVSGKVPIPSSFAISLDSVPDGLRGSVDRGRVGYALTRDTTASIVFGSPVPHMNVDAYFFYPLGDLDQTLGFLGRVLIGVSLGAVLLAVLAGTRVSTRVVDPVRRASKAARRVAEGLLEAEFRRLTGEIAARFRDVTGPAISQHLRVLLDAGLVAGERRVGPTPAESFRHPTQELREVRGATCRLNAWPGRYVHPSLVPSGSNRRSI
jgi:DNA-binding transcriptional ArsR family regulator